MYANFANYGAKQSKKPSLYIYIISMCPTVVNGPPPLFQTPSEIKEAPSNFYDKRKQALSSNVASVSGFAK